MFSFSVPELGIVLVIALMVFGPGKLPDVGKALGKSIKEVRRAADEINNPPADVAKIEARTEKTDKA